MLGRPLALLPLCLKQGPAEALLRTEGIPLRCQARRRLPPVAIAAASYSRAGVITVCARSWFASGYRLTASPPQARRSLQAHPHDGGVHRDQ